MTNPTLSTPAKIPSCPECKAEINHLDHYKDKRELSIFLSDGTEIKEDSIYIEDSTAFECPKCTEVIASKKEEALKILNPNLTYTND